jgi:hypothetical protein
MFTRTEPFNTRAARGADLARSRFYDRSDILNCYTETLTIPGLLCVIRGANANLTMHPDRQPISTAGNATPNYSTTTPPIRTGESSYSSTSLYRFTPGTQWAGGGWVLATLPVRQN